MMVYGWSPGQIPLPSAVLRPNRKMLQAMSEAAAAPLAKASDGAAAVYFPEPRHFEDAVRMPVNVSPLIFLDWHEDEAVKVIQQYGWRRPDDTDPNSTNCLLNAFANQVHSEADGIPCLRDGACGTGAGRLYGTRRCTRTFGGPTVTGVGIPRRGAPGCFTAIPVRNPSNSRAIVDTMVIAPIIRARSAVET